MNNYTKATDRFLTETMTPEMIRIHTHLVSLEELGYESPTIQEYRHRMDVLAPIYSFLSEAVAGEEEYLWQDLKMLIDMTELGYIDNVKGTGAAITGNFTIWLGVTQELFTIDASKINEITDLNIGPNDGSNTTGQHLDSIWINAQTDLDSTTSGKLENDTRISVEPGVAHVLIITPMNVNIATIEMNTMGGWYEVHSYGESIIPNVYDPSTGLIENKKCYFLRDVSNGIYSTNTGFRVTTQ